MPAPYYESFREPLTSGFRITYVTAPGGYHPPHWHEELEILFHLNGESDITIDGKKYQLHPKHMIVVDARQVHSTFSHDPTSMFVCIHISKSYMEKYVPGLDLYQFRCTPEDIRDDNFQDYLDTCMLLQDLTKAYIRNPLTLAMETEGYVLQIFARLIQHFSRPQSTLPENASLLNAERIRTVISYVIAHYKEPVSLQEAADQLGFSKEYFCRFFKKAMGISFLQYVNEVRAAHIYQDLENTDLPVAEIMEQNGFTNQKLFNRTFKSIYGCTPSAVKRKAAAAADRT
ncbi:MAG: AraC family transcriptional regulator [Lachnospiraceae bacterium]|nr:AraC family transcriptional regulator [Lachnospiraceae bacterium]